MNCKTCNVPLPAHELRAGLCLDCLAKELSQWRGEAVRKASELKEARAELERVKAQSAAFRSELEQHQRCIVECAGCIPDGRGRHNSSFIDVGRSVRELLKSTDAGKDFIPKSDVKPLASELKWLLSVVDIDAMDAKHKGSYDRLLKVIADAKAKGLV